MFPSDHKLSGFDLIQTNYKYVGNHGIRSDLIVPQTSFAGKRPVIIRFHGGGLMTGDSLFLEWLPFWLLDLAKKYNAVIVSPNYRLLPEATSLEIFDDIEDFWTWLHSSTVTELLSQSNTELDLDRIFTAGDSAGGLLSICLALHHPDEIRAATAAYPSVDMGSSAFSVPRTTGLMGTDYSEDVPKSYLARMKPGDIISASPLPNRFDLMFGATQHGYLHRFYERGTEADPRRELRYPLEKLEQDGVKVPRGGIVITHGIRDSVVPVDGCERFVERAREVFRGQDGGERIVLALRDGEHGFDNEARLEDGWLWEAIQSAVESWLE